MQKLTGANAKIGNGTITIVAEKSFTRDVANLADGAGEQWDETVTGVKPGDFALANVAYNLQGIIVTAHVRAADSVTVRVQNETGQTIDLGSATWKIKAIR